MPRQCSRIGQSVLKAIVFAIFVGSALSASQSQAQSRILAPSTAQPLPAQFTLLWERGNAREFWLYMGSAQGRNDYYSASQGTRTSSSFTLLSPLDSVWVRLYSLVPIYSGYAKSTVAGYQWVALDYRYTCIKTVASSQIIDSALSWGNARNGLYGGQCKEFVRDAFNQAFTSAGAKTPAGVAAIVPSNGGGYYWLDTNTNSGFRWIARVLPRSGSTTQVAHLASLKALVLKGKRGDVIQYGGLSTEILLHTLILTEDVGTSGVVHWMDSNWDSTKPRTIGTARSKSVTDFTTFVGKAITINNVIVNRGMTLYRVRDDLRR